MHNPSMSTVTIVGSYIVALVMDVERIPLEGETLTGGNYHTTHGGKGSNMAVCAARLGADTAFFGKIGRDAFGEKFLALLIEEKVSPNAVLFAERLPTAVGFIIFSAQGSNVIVIDPAANGDFSPADVRAHPAVVCGAGVTLAPLEIPLSTALAAGKLAKAAGKKFILNPAPAQDLRGADLGDVFVLTPNEREARVCLGLAADDPTPDHEIATRLRALGPEHVMITCGGRGVLWAGPDGLQVVPAPAVEVVDTVGAGDAFNAGLAVGLAEGRPILEAIALGVTAATLSTRKRETIASYAFRPEVDAHVGATLAAAHFFKP
ncbi:MAG: ribokinase [Opitutaceae bacterium]|nr:ribokinase [Opitutaceae bacterium]